MNRFVLRQSLLLLVTAIIWGIAFVAQSTGMDYVEPFTFSMMRNLIGAIVLLPCIALLKKFHGNGSHRRGYEEGKSTGHFPERKMLLAGGISCGILLFIASNLQQFGILYTSVGKTGFITAMYIVMVPIIGIFLRKKVGGRVWAAVVIAVGGLYMLCGTGGSLALGKGELLVLGGALGFSFHILVIDYFAPYVDGVKMSCIQFFVCALLSGMAMLFFEEPGISLILAAWMPILYAGVLSCGVAYTLQIISQRGMNPTVASLILSLESVVSVIAGWVFLGQLLSDRELFGCAVMFGAIVLVQLPQGRKVLGETMEG